MKKISILILLIICYANIFGFGLHEINKMNEKNVTSLEFIDISGRDSDENKKYYSTDNKEIITKYIKDLKILKKEEIHYFGASYGVPTLKFKVVENGRVKYYKQIPIKEMESTIDEYKVFFKEYTLINCYVEKGLKLKSVIEYLDNHRYKYYPLLMIFLMKNLIVNYYCNLNHQSKVWLYTKLKSFIKITAKIKKLINIEYEYHQERKNLMKMEIKCSIQL